MKILQIITQGERGGAQLHVRDSALGLQARGHDVYVATGKQSGLADRWLFEELEKGGFDRLQLRIIRDLQRDVHFSTELRAFSQTYKLVKSIKPDIVHVHSSKAGSLCATAARLAGAKVVYTVHGFVFNEPMSVFSKYFYLVSELVARFFRNYTITVSKFDLATGRKYHIIPKKKGIAIYNGIDPHKVDSILTKEKARTALYDKMGFTFPKGIRIIGLVANLYPAKGVEYLIDAAYLAERYKGLTNTIFIVIGEGELRKELEEQIKEHNVQGIFFLMGAVPDAYKYLKAFDLFVMPSVKEGFPYALLEVMMARVPFIATKVGGIPEIAEYAQAPLVEPGSAKYLTEKIVDFIANEKPVSRKKVKYIESGLPKKFTQAAMVAEIEGVYGRVRKGRV